MAIVKSIPSQRVINGFILNTSEISVVSEREYKTSGESCLIVRATPQCSVTLDSRSTDHIVIKAISKTIIKPDVSKIDEKYDELVLDNDACVEFRFCLGHWYILSSDGLKY